MISTHKILRISIRLESSNPRLRVAGVAILNAILDAQAAYEAAGSHL